MCDSWSRYPLHPTSQWNSLLGWVFYGSVIWLTHLPSSMSQWVTVAKTKWINWTGNRYAFCGFEFMIDDNWNEEKMFKFCFYCIFSSKTSFTNLHMSMPRKFEIDLWMYWVLQTLQSLLNLRIINWNYMYMIMVMYMHIMCMYVCIYVCLCTCIRVITVLLTSPFPKSSLIK